MDGTRNPERTLVIAHRGYSLEAPENTIDAFEKGLSAGAVGVELDVWRCRSGELVVVHDEAMPGLGSISAFPLRLLGVSIARSQRWKRSWRVYLRR